EPHAVVAELERPDGDVELEPGRRAHIADGAGVGLTARLLQGVDDLHRTYLRGTGHRARREGRTEQVAVPDTLVETADDVGDQMPHAGVTFRARLIGHPDGSGQAHATDVVAHQVDDHDVL